MISSIPTLKSKTYGRDSPMLAQREPAWFLTEDDAVMKIELEGLCVSYGNHAVLKDFSLGIDAGKIVGIVGPSGCGKTTIVRALCGFINPEKGTVKIDGKVMFSAKERKNIPPEQRRIGVVFQDYAVWPHLSVFDNIAYPLKKRKTPKDEISSLVDYALGQVNMVGYEKYMPAQLSGGQQQRVAIARALTSSSGLLVMDEPITNLDAKLREQMLVEIRLLQQRLGTTILYITHDQEAAMQLCDQIVILHQDGSIAQIGTDEQIIEEPANQFVFQFIGVSNFLKVNMNGGECHIDGTDIVICDHRPDGYPDDCVEAYLGVRPMDIIFDDGSPIRGKVTQSVFLGNLYNYFIDFQGQELRVQRIMGAGVEDDDYKEGREVGLVFLQRRFFKREVPT